MNKTKIELTMLSLGVEQSSCCDKIFERGETMRAIVSDDGEPLGWWCGKCLRPQMPITQSEDTQLPDMESFRLQENSFAEGGW